MASDRYGAVREGNTLEQYTTRGSDREDACIHDSSGRCRVVKWYDEEVREKAALAMLPGMCLR